MSTMATANTGISTPIAKSAVNSFLAGETNS